MSELNKINQVSHRGRQIKNHKTSSRWKIRATSGLPDTVRVNRVRLLYVVYYGTTPNKVGVIIKLIGHF